MTRARSVLVTGASGFIGTRLVEALREAGHEVRTPEGPYYLLKAEPPHFIPPDATIHLAAATFSSWQTNVLGTARVTDWAVSGKPLVFASTLNAQCPADQYEREKALGEEIVQSRRGIETVVLRLGNVYGPGPQSQRCVLNRLMRQAHAGETLNLHGNVFGVRDYVYVDDVARAFVLALDAPPGVYDVGTGAPRTLLEAVDEVRRQMYPARVVAQEDWTAQIQPHAPIAVESRWLPGWQPTVAFPEGVRRTLEWLREHEPVAAAAESGAAPQEAVPA